MAAELPENMSQWPSDPFELLGVKLPAEERELKRAYTALIRRFKPDEFPAEFQRIREAYELAKQTLGWRSMIASSPESDERKTSQPEPSRNQSSSTPLDAAFDQDTEPREKRAAKSAWDLACQGKLIDAYRQLRSLPEPLQKTDEVAAQLYWLLTLDPTLDEHRTPEECLPNCFQSSSPYSRSDHLFLRTYRRTRNPKLEKSYREAFQKDPAIARLQFPLRVRWPILGKQKKWERIQNELTAAETSFLDDTSGWLHVNLIALELASRSPDPEAEHLVRQIHNTFQANESLALQQPWHFDQADLEFQLFQTLRALRANPGATAIADLQPFVEKICELKLLPWALQRTSAQQLVGNWIDEPHEFLKMLDRLMQWQPIVLGDLLDLLDSVSRSGNSTPETLNGDDLKDLLEQETILVHAYWRAYQDYGRFRHGLMTFCLDELVQVDDVSAQLQALVGPDSDTAKTNRELIFRDLPLRALIKGASILWI